jgi:hypothetical protein
MAQALDAVSAQAGGDSCAAYAARELVSDRESHQSGLQKVIGGTDLPLAMPKGRKPEVSTLPESSDADTETTESYDVPKTPRRTWRWAAMVLTIVLAGAGVGLLIPWHDEDTSPPATQPDPPDPVSTDKTPEVKEPDETKPPETRPAAITPVEGEDPPAPKKRKRRKRKGRRKVHAKPVMAVPDPPTTEPTAFGYITVGATPYALVRIDGKQVGITPVNRHRLPVGPHEIVLVRPDTGEVRHRERVTIEEGKTRKLVVDKRP